MVSFGPEAPDRFGKDQVVTARRRGGR